MTTSPPAICERCGDFLVGEAVRLCENCQPRLNDEYFQQLNRAYRRYFLAGGLLVAAFGAGVDNGLWLYYIKGWDIVARLVFGFGCLFVPMIGFAMGFVVSLRGIRERAGITAKDPVYRAWWRAVGRRWGRALAVTLLVLSGWLIPAVLPYYNTQLAYNLGWFAIAVYSFFLTRPIPIMVLTQAAQSGSPRVRQ